MKIEIPVVRLTFTLAFMGTFRKPVYAGSMLRGQFGHQLRRSACITNLSDCSACPIRTSCPYTQLFEPRIAAPSGQTPRIPYILRDSHWGSQTLSDNQTWQFHQTLMGPYALEQAPLIAWTWQQVAQQGLGKERIPATIVQITDSHGTPLLDPESDSIQRPSPISIQSEPPHNHWQIATPWRYYERKRLIKPANFRPDHLYHALYYRLRDLNDSLLDKTLPLEPDIPATLMERPMTHSFRWTRLERYSNRQKRPIDISGITGTFNLHAPDARHSLMLQAAKWLHIGKNTSLGLGALEPLSKNTAPEP